MSQKINIGKPFAFAFFAAQLSKTHPSSVYAFSQLVPARAGRFMSDAKKVNILWRVAAADMVCHELEPDIEKKIELRTQQTEQIAVLREKIENEYGGVLYRGVFTTENYLLHGLGMPVKVVGPPVSLVDFVDGPIRRVDPPRTAQERFRLRTGFAGAGLVTPES